MTKVVLATGNPGKVTEMQRELEHVGLQVVSQSDYNFAEAIEDGLSFVENAIKKARNACLHTGLPAIADDSGLEVDALNGAPGIYSARYANGQGDAANNKKLLTAMSHQTHRGARYQCIIAFMQYAEDPSPILCHGSWEGLIAKTPVGSNGFGYDPIFYVPEFDCTAAELEPEQKKSLSHRAKALEILKTALSGKLSSLER